MAGIPRFKVIYATTPEDLAKKLNEADPHDDYEIKWMTAHPWFEAQDQHPTPYMYQACDSIYVLLEQRRYA